jgi:membrane protein YqaA with SNARE-associated domain
LRDQLINVINKETESYGIIFLFFVSILLEIVPQYIGPHFLLFQAVLIGFSPYMTAISISLGSLTGSIIGFEIGKKYGIRLISRIYGGDKLRNTNRLLNGHGKWIISLTAISPLPYLPPIFGSLGLTRKKFMLYGLIPRVLGLIIFSIIVKLYS